jgi:hypothetical protein
MTMTYGPDLQPKVDPIEAERQRAEAMIKLAKMPLGANLVGNLRAIHAARAIQAGDIENMGEFAAE